MRTPVGRIEVAAGGFLAVVAVLVVLALFGSMRRTNLLDVFRARLVITAIADDAYGASVGSPVKVRDVEVGTVTEVALVPEQTASGKPVRIRMRVQPNAAAFLGDQTVAVIVRPPFGSGMPPFGTSSIELRSAGTSPLALGAVIAAEGEDSMVSTFAKLRGDVFAIREQLVTTLQSLSGTLDNMRTLTDGLAHGRGFAGRMLSDEKTADALAALLSDARAATAELRGVASDVKGASAQAPALVRGASETNDEAKKLLARLDKAMDALPTIVASAERTLAAAEQLTGTLQVAASHAPELARKVDSSLDETNRLVEAAQRNFLLRSTLPDRPTLRTGADVRPQASVEDAGAP